LVGLDAESRDARGKPSLLVDTRVSSVAPLAELRALVLSGDFDNAVSQALRSEARVDAASFMPSPGAAVRLHGLSQNVSLNGCIGEVVRLDQASGRLNVRLADGEHILVRHACVAPAHVAALADRSESARRFEAEAVRLDTLTPHQQAALAEMDGARAPHLHLRAPAGAGKTFVALHRMLDALQPVRDATGGDGAARECKDGARVLFIARNEALALFAAGWLARRAHGGVQGRRRLLSRLHLMHEPLHLGPCSLSLHRGRIVRHRLSDDDKAAEVVRDDDAAGACRDGETAWVAGSQATDAPVARGVGGYSLVVVDEAHHLYSRPDARAAIQPHVTAGAQLLLLSDLSQAASRVVPYPPGLAEVQLSEVVRCSSRIVAGAMAFQLGGEAKLLTHCHHRTAGPPLRSFLFDLETEPAGEESKLAAAVPHAKLGSGGSGGVDGRSQNGKEPKMDAAGRRARAYARHVLRAIDHAVSLFPGLPLHNRLALLVPDESFRESLKREMAGEVMRRWNLRLVSAQEACCEVAEGDEEGGGAGQEEEEGEHAAAGDVSSVGTSGGGSAMRAVGSGGASSTESMTAEDGELGLRCPAEGSILLDTVSNMDGLERLIVVAVGLDSPMKPATASPVKSGESGAGLPGCGTAAEGGSGDGALLEARSMIYRALTRAQLLATVVNEIVEGGWLEFLLHVRMREDETFDASTAMARAETAAVEVAVRAQICDAIAARVMQVGARAPGESATAWLAGEAAAMQERGASPQEAVSAVVQGWASAAEQALSALRAERLSLASPFGVVATDADLEGLCDAAALSLAKGDAPHSDLVARDTLRRWLDARESTCVQQAVRQAAAASHTFLQAFVAPSSAASVAAPQDASVDAAAPASALPCVEPATSLAHPVPSPAGSLSALDTPAARSALEVIRKTVVDSVKGMGPDRQGAADGRATEASNAASGVSAGRVADTSQLAGAGDAAGGTSAGGSEGGPTIGPGADGGGSGLDEGSPGALAAAAEAAVRRWLALEEEAAHQLLLLPAAGTRDSTEPALEWARRTMPDTLHGAVADVLGGKELTKALDARCIQWQYAQVEAAARAAIDRACGSEVDIAALGGEEARAAMVAEIVDTCMTAMLEIEDAPARLPWENVEAGQVVTFWLIAHAEVSLALAKESRRAQSEMPSVAELLPSLVAMTRAGRVSLAQALQSTLTEWSEGELATRRRDALIASAIEEAARDLRLQLPAPAERRLRLAVLAALERGEQLSAAVDAAVEDYSTRLLRQRVQQTVWDPAGNQARNTACVPSFMPFRRGGEEAFDHDVLQHVFSLLPFSMLRTLALVCKRWHGVATDSSWQPDLLVFAWGAVDCCGLSAPTPRPTPLPFSIQHELLSFTCADDATLALCADGSVFHWGRSWRPSAPVVTSPTRIPQLRDVVALAATPPGYYHERRQGLGFSAAAITRAGALYTWGANGSEQLLHKDPHVPWPRRVPNFGSVALGGTEPEGARRVSHIALGLHYLALATRPAGTVAGRRTASEELPHARAAQPTEAASSPQPDPSDWSCVLTCGSFGSHGEEPHPLQERPELRGVPLRSLCAGAFHCCALSTTGELYTWGHEAGQDLSNGNLLGHGEPAGSIRPPQRVAALAAHPVVEVSASTYCTMAITVDQRVFTWGDSDGDALGHSELECHTPKWLSEPPLRGLRIAHGAMAYTNAAVATDDGRVFQWGGNAWERGVAGGRGVRGPSEVEWAGAPPCYMCSSVALAWRHGYMVLRKKP
jgi:alpha-tubulin suppressor-like RCC1 family protein